MCFLLISHIRLRQKSTQSPTTTLHAQTTTKMVCNHHARLRISSLYTHVPWPVSLHSEPLIPETDENRLSAFVTGRPRPSRRLQWWRKSNDAVDIMRDWQRLAT